MKILIEVATIDNKPERGDNKYKIGGQNGKRLTAFDRANKRREEKKKKKQEKKAQKQKTK